MDKINQFNLNYLIETLGDKSIVSVDRLGMINTVTIDPEGFITENRSKIVKQKQEVISRIEIYPEDDFYDFHLSHLVSKVREAKCMEKVQNNIFHMGLVELNIK